ncbi:MAG TPA: hypothetical protein VGF04_03750 [Solirubrobacterales bacterium]
MPGPAFALVGAAASSEISVTATNALPPTKIRTVADGRETVIIIPCLSEASFNAALTETVANSICRAGSS